ncbi:MAG TPA: hypothetical protein VGD65_22255 [Chryseosolibacter sp.]
MKYFFFFVCWGLFFLAMRIFRGEAGYVLATYGIVLMLGILLNFLPGKESRRLRAIGWGFFWGALAFGFLVIIGFILLSYLMTP